MAKSHRWNFNKTILIQQDVSNRIELLEVPNLVCINTAEYLVDVLTKYGLHPDPDAERWSSGKYYWKNHNINHFVAADYSDAEYILFSDNDCGITKNGEESGVSWVQKAIECLEKYPDVLLVCPDEGGHECMTRVPEGRIVQSCSQQLFLVRRKTFLGIDFSVPFDASVFESDPTLRTSTRKAPGDPFKDFYFCLEGRMWRYMDAYKKYRLILNPEWRYDHWFGKIAGKL